MISVTDPIQRSIDWTRNLLFAPFEIGKWCVMGFTAFLAQLLSGGASSFRAGRSFKGLGSGGRGTAPLEGLDEVRLWLLAHLTLVAVLVLLVLALAVVLTWLGARGQFLFLDNVVNNRARVAEPWARYREHGNRLFVFLLGLQVAGLVLVGGGLYAGWRVAAPDVAELQFGLAALKGILLAVGLIVPVGFVLAMAGQVARDFVVPVMYLRGTTVGEGFGVWWNELVPGNGGSFVLFYLMKALLSMAAGVVVLLGTCLTCCLAGLPYVSSVVFLPVSVFFRAYPLAFMAQCGEPWRLLGAGSEH